MALFIIMFSIASVNTAKFSELKVSLKDAFSGKVLPGGKSIANGSDSAAVASPLPALSATSHAAAQREDDDLARLKQRIEAYARQQGLSSQLDANIERRGLVITILTDKLLFDSGQATLHPQGARLIASIGELLRREDTHNVTVEGYTDTVPSHGSAYPTNWELSTARASTVVRTLLDARVAPQRLTASGRAYLDPVASNATAAGRERNRRVQIVLPRRSGVAAGEPAAPPLGPVQLQPTPQANP
jgi:chemotaxis protein MotB